MQICEVGVGHAHEFPVRLFIPLTRDTDPTYSVHAKDTKEDLASCRYTLKYQQ